MKNSKIVLGTAQFGLNYGINNPIGKPCADTVFEILDKAAILGISELDTADGYGEATEVLRRYFLKAPHCFNLMSKCSLQDELSFTEIFNESLKRLGVGTMEGYYFHRFSDFVNFKDFNQVHLLKKAGKLKHLAVSLYTDEDLEIASEHPEVDLIQLPFNILDRGRHKVELLKKAKSHNKKIYVRSVFLQGLFFMSVDKLPPKLRCFEKVITEISLLAEEYNMSIEELCLNYVYHKDFIDKLVLGIDSSAQLTANLNSLHSVFPKELEHCLEQIQLSDLSLLNPNNWN